MLHASAAGKLKAKQRISAGSSKASGLTTPALEQLSLGQMRLEERMAYAKVCCWCTGVV
jgi:hypothetical protein